MDDLSDLYDNYDPNMSTDRPNMEPLPIGEYVVQITEAKRVDKDSGDVMVKLTMQVEDGEFAGRYLWENLNLRHSNAMAQEIAQRSFTELWREAMNLTQPPASLRDLEFKPFVAKVGIEKRKDTGENQNRIKAYKPLGHAPAAAAPPRGPAPAVNRTATAPAQDRRPAFLKKAS
jgi:hypothetical protein